MLSDKVQDTVEKQLVAIECGSAMEQYQEMCFRYKWFGWESLE